jgi:hypothetical protein
MMDNYIPTKKLKRKNVYTTLIPKPRMIVKEKKTKDKYLL